MKRNKYTEEQIIQVLKDGESKSVGSRPLLQVQDERQQLPQMEGQIRQFQCERAEETESR